MVIQSAQIVELYRHLLRLETPRLCLRPLTLSDVSDVFVFASDPQVTRFLRWSAHPSLAGTESYIRDVLQEYADGHDGPWGIVHKDLAQVVGTVHLMNVNAHHQKAEVGIVLNRNMWGQGLATEVLDCVLGYAFAQLGLNRIEAMPRVENKAALRVLEQVGMVREGMLRQAFLQKGAFVDVYIYARLRGFPTL